MPLNLPVRPSAFSKTLLMTLALDLAPLFCQPQAKCLRQSITTNEFCQEAEELQVVGKRCLLEVPKGANFI